MIHDIAMWPENVQNSSFFQNYQNDPKCVKIKSGAGHMSLAKSGGQDSLKQQEAFACSICRYALKEIAVMSCDISSGMWCLLACPGPCSV